MACRPIHRVALPYRRNGRFFLLPSSRRLCGGQQALVALDNWRSYGVSHFKSETERVYCRKICSAMLMAADNST
jgi:hypothetical protein